MNLALRRLPAASFCLLGLCASLSPRPSAGQEQWRFEGVERQVVIPDVHGAFDEFAQLLRATGIVDDNLDWTGGETHLVSLGDLLDRGPDSRKAMDLLMRLEEQAAAVGGKVHVILGNHELLVLMGDMRYVSEGEYEAFAADEPDDVRERAFEWFVAETPGASDDPEAARKAFDLTFPPGYFALRAAFAADGRYGRWLLDLPAITVIDNTAYVHAGLPGFVSEMSLDDLNERVAADLEEYVRSWESLVAAGHLPRFERQDPKDLASEALFIADPSRCNGELAALCEGLALPDDPGPVDAALVATLERFIELSESPTLSSDGPMWYRGSVYCKPILEEPVLDAALTRLGVERVVVGHTPTADRRVHSLYDGRLLMTDTGMLVSYYAGRPAALIVENGETTVQYLQPNERRAPLTGGQTVVGNLNPAAVLTALGEGDLTLFEQSGEGPWQTAVRYEGREFLAMFHPDEAGKREQAAFTLDELLGLDLVPPTVTRRVEGHDGALQFWYPDAITEKQRADNQLGIGGWCSVDAQFGLMYAFDYLTYNPGRSEDNLLYRRSLWSVHVTGHGQAFESEDRLPDQVSELELAPGTAEALRALNEDTLREAMEGLLDRGQIRALLARRDRILEATGAR